MADLPEEKNHPLIRQSLISVDHIRAEPVDLSKILSATSFAKKNERKIIAS